MDLIKKNIHMDRIRTQAVSQITLEDDMNIPDNKPDVSTINFDRGIVVIDEVKPYTDYVNVRGKLIYNVLYQTDEGGASLVTLEGKIPFDEKINLQGVSSSDAVSITSTIEDLTVGIINSRKLSIQSVITLLAKVEEIYDVETPIGVYGEELIEFRKTPMNIAQMQICKNDILRVKEEITLPSNYTNMSEILWSSMSLSDVEYKAMEEKLAIQGEVNVFVLYEAEGEEYSVRSFETTLPFSGILECHGCKDNMIPDLKVSIGQQDISIRPDLDGEERVLGIDLSLDICMKIYEEEKIELITDLYGVNKEVETIANPANLRRMLAKVSGKTKIADRVRIKNRDAGILQLLHSEGNAILEHKQVTGNGLELLGSLQVRVMYITGDDNTPYASVKAQIPFRYTLEIPDISPEDISDVSTGVEQLQVTMLDGEEMDVKAILVFRTTAFKNLPVELIGDVKITDIDSATLSNLPGMVVYIVKSGDNLWNIGKKYYVSVDKICDVNGLASEEVSVGQKLLVVKGT